MIIRAKKDIAYDFEDYGIDFIKGKSYTVKVIDKTSGEYYLDTENGSEVLITDADIQSDFDIIK